MDGRLNIKASQMALLNEINGRRSTNWNAPLLEPMGRGKSQLPKARAISLSFGEGAKQRFAKGEARNIGIITKLFHKTNTSHTTSITCKRTLTHTTDTSAYHFWKVKLINAWTGNNDNVAMGGDCNTYSRDFYYCVDDASYALSYDDLTTDYPAPFLGDFKPDESNIVLQAIYTNYYWTNYVDPYDDHPAKRLAYYTHSGNWYYADNIGYDTLLSSSLGKEVVPINTESMVEMSDLNCYPNPFRTSINIDAEPYSVNFIYDYNGHLVDKLEGSTSWKPEEKITPGVYLIKSRISGKKENVKKIYYIK